MTRRALEVCRVYGDIRESRGVELISNFWRALANDAPTLRRMLDSFNSTMAPGALDPLTKELLFLAVSATNGCAYCTALHGSIAKGQGLSSEMLDELMAVVGLANEANRLAAIYRIPVDDRHEALLDELVQTARRSTDAAPRPNGRRATFRGISRRSLLFCWPRAMRGWARPAARPPPCSLWILSALRRCRRRCRPRSGGDDAA